MTFEENIKQLEGIVVQLDKADLSLEKRLTLFKTGMDLTVQLATQLSEAKKSVEILVKETGKMETFQLQEKEVVKDARTSGEG